MKGLHSHVLYPCPCDLLFGTVSSRTVSVGDCCVRQRLKQKGVTGYELMSQPKWKLALMWLGKLTKMTIADVEWRHNRGRVRLHKDCWMRVWRRGPRRLQEAKVWIFWRDLPLAALRLNFHSVGGEEGFRHDRASFTS